MTANNLQSSIAQAFDRSHGGRIQSATVERNYRAAFGDDYPGTAQPNAFYSRATLHPLAAALQVGSGQTVVDLGCGHGGPGLWVAQQTGVSLIGIDFSPVGDRAGTLPGSGGRSGRAGALPGGRHVCDGSSGRVLRCGHELGRAPVCSGSDCRHARSGPSAPPGRAVRVQYLGRAGDSPVEPHALAPATETIDYRRLVERAGLQVEICEEPPGWRSQQQRLAEGIVAAEAEVSQDMGVHYPAMARSFLRNLPKVRYLFVVARRTSDTSR